MGDTIARFAGRVGEDAPGALAQVSLGGLDAAATGWWDRGCGARSGYRRGPWGRRNCGRIEESGWSVA